MRFRNENHARSRERLCEAAARVGYEVEAHMRSLIRSHCDFARAPEGFELLPLLRVKHIVNPFLEAPVGPH